MTTVSRNFEKALWPPVLPLHSCFCTIGNELRYLVEECSCFELFSPQPEFSEEFRTSGGADKPMCPPQDSRKKGRRTTDNMQSLTSRLMSADVNIGELRPKVNSDLALPILSRDTIYAAVCLFCANIKLRANLYCTLGRDCSHVAVAILSPHLESCIPKLPFVRQHAVGSLCHLRLVQALHGELLQRPAISAHMF